MSKKILSGISASRGEASGKVRVLLPQDDTKDFTQDEILVTTITNPAMVPAMIKAAAIVTDIGGLTSHPSIISRELGIPCIVNTKTATKDLKNGMKVKVNGSTGEVYVVD